MNENWRQRALGERRPDDGRQKIIESVLQHHLPILLGNTDEGDYTTLCMCSTKDGPDVFEGPVYHRQHVAALIVQWLDRCEPEPNRPADDPEEVAAEIAAEMAELTEAEVCEHVSTVMFDTHDADPDCLMCRRGVEIGAWAHYGYPNGPWAAEPPEGTQEDIDALDGSDG